MKSSLPLIAAILLIMTSSCESIKEKKSEKFYFLTKLGSDTLAVEEISKKGSDWHIRSIVRSPKTTLRKYDICLDAEGNMVSYNTLISSGSDTTVISSKTEYSFESDSITIDLNREGEERVRTVETRTTALPFIDMIHWPFEIACERIYGNNINQPMLAGVRYLDFEIATLAEDSMTIKHPSRGYMGVSVTKKGEITYLDAGLTTRKLSVTRLQSLDFNMIFNRFTELDKQGKAFGGLSGRGSFNGMVSGAEISVDYGQPSKRGREIWGALVPYGERWRTGANRATHFKTSKNLMVGGIELPAGEYTFFTIPENNGGVLIINKQTGQNGRTYDKELDHCRVEMTFRNLDEEVEKFTIQANEVDGAGELVLQWDRKELFVPFTVLD